MKRSLVVALAGFGYLAISISLFIPLRMKPIANYNLFIFPLFIAGFLFLFYKACTVAAQTRAYVYAYFAGMMLWQVIGEMVSLRVNEGLILQFSDVNIKTVGGYFYVLLGLVVLFIAWKTKTLKAPACFCFMIFFGIWGVELYLDNYTAVIALDRMPATANVLGVIAAVLSIFILCAAKKTTAVEKQIFLGGLLYLTFSVVFMSMTLWQKPLTFYLKHERAAIEHEIKAMQEELGNIDQIKKQIGMKDDDSISNQMGFEKTR